MGFTVEADVARLVDTVGQAGDDLRAGLPAADEQAAADVLGHVDPPVLTGRLKSTVRAQVEALGFTIAAGGQQAPYVGFVHARDPFLTRAITDREAAVVDHYADALAEVVNQIGA